MGKAKKDNEEIIEELKSSNKKAKSKKEINANEQTEDTNKKVQDILKKAKEKGQITYGELASQLEEEFPLIDIELNYGGQPLYYYIASVE